ncbi:VOC family protein [Paraglaciecola sp. 2405UD69-4]|uniref:VOC family protein n=1 Tax=Paraglaciecola sp. 2405UD69-4 TaxID=3391836 RepID=UPI0039C9D6C6
MAAVSQFDCHGQIRCGTISVSSLEKSLTLYRDYLDFQPIEQGKLDKQLASLWGLPKMTGAAYVVLQAPSGGPSLIRLIEVPAIKGFVPATSYGWSAFEITVADVFKLAEKLENSDFKIVGPPKLVDGFTSFIPMQVFGPDGEILFLNQVNHSDEDADLPLAQCNVDQLFIVVLAALNRGAAVLEYEHSLALDQAATHHLRYSLINRAFNLDMDTKQSITMMQKGRSPFAQIDQYPPNAVVRPCHDGWLPPGNSMVSVLVDNIDELPIETKIIATPAAPQGTIYQGRKTALIRGAVSECIELIQIA